MTFSFSVAGSRKEAPYHPFSDEQAKAFDEAVKALTESLAKAGLTGAVNGSRPGTQAEFEARPRLSHSGGDYLDTSSAKVEAKF